MHRQPQRHGGAHLFCEIPKNGQVEAEGAQADGVWRQQACQSFLREEWYAVAGTTPGPQEPRINQI